MPCPDLLANRSPRLLTHGRQKAHKEPLPTMGAARPEGIAEEVKAGVLCHPSTAAVFAIHDLRLVGVQFEAKSPEPGSDSSPQIPGLPLGVAVGNNIVSVALEGAARILMVHPTIERIVHEQVGQQGRDRGTLRGSFLPSHESPVRHLHRGAQPPSDAEQDPTLVCMVGHRFEQQIMRNTVEEGPNIEIDNPVLLPTALSRRGQRVVGRTPRTIAVAVRMEDRLQLFFQRN
jgi:hypothetical protein